MDVNSCLVLLGEPGIGKTTELERAVVVAGENAHYVDLGAVPDAETLRLLIVDAPPVRTWRAGDGSLVLFLDAFDEAIAERAVLGRVLIDELGGLPRERLRVRIACRTADWPATLADRLADLFTEARVYELQPLTRGDVVAIAEESGVDGEAFLSAVTERGAGPLARVPLTLRFLLDLFRVDGALPTERVDLYREGCRELCREQNRSRLETNRTGSLTAEERLTIAERIAGATVLGGRSAVRVRGTGAASAIVELAELDGGCEWTSADVVAIAGDVDVDQPRLRETLATGLFSGRGDDVVGFAHHSYSEFLSARFLHRHRFDVRRALNLMAQERGGRQRIVPQLAGVSGWLADIDSDFLEWLIANEPEVALRADVAAMDDARKSALVDALLARADAERLTELGHSSLGALARSDLADQLRPWVRSQGSGPARRLAIELTGAAGASDLYELLVERVLDPEEEMRIRIDCGWALWKNAEPDLRAQLKPLALDAPETDTDDDLKGVALLCTWPESITVEELVQTLTPPKVDNYLGAYGLFLGQELMSRLDDRGLVLMLAWARELAPAGQHHRFSDLIDGLLLAAWPRLSVDAVAAGFAETAAVLLGSENGLGARSYRSAELDELVSGDRDGRRRLAELLVPMVGAGALQPYHLASGPVVQSEDLIWLIERAVEASNEDEKRTWARIADFLFRRPPSFDEAEAVLRACANDPAIATTIDNVYGAVPVDSPEAVEARERHARWLDLAAQRAERDRERAAYYAATPARLRSALERVESGEVDSYLAVDAELLREPAPRGVGRDSGDIRVLSTWQGADPGVRQRILEAAATFVSSGSLDGEAWSPASLAGYRALRLLRAEEAQFSIDGERLGALVATMLRHPVSGDDDRRDAGELIAFAASVIPEVFTTSVLKAAEEEAAQHSHVFFLGRLASVPVGAVDEALCDFVRERDHLSAHALSSVLEAVLERGAPCATMLAVAIVEGRGESADDTLAVSSACLLLVFANEREPAASVIEAMQTDPPFGRRVVERLADRGPLRRSIPALPEDLTADLFLITAAEFGWDDERWTGHDVGSWRSSLLARLRDAGTDEAHLQLQRLQNELPHLDWLARVAEEGETRTLAATWEPPSPAEVIAVAVSRSQRYVTSGDQLLEVVIDGLGEIQRDLEADSSAADSLWRAQEEADSYVPLSEPEASTVLQERLREKLTGDRGIIFQREVQIIQPPGPWPGERTDVHVTGIVQHVDRDAEELTTIVEVKGCWHADVPTAFETQLVDSYLLPTRNRYGIYCVLWFESDRWSEGDYRRAACGRRERQETMAALDERARELEAEHGLYLGVVELTVRLA